MIFGVFSLNPNNMRWFNVKRIVSCLFLFPIFLFLLINNRIFLLLDYVLFPQFIRQKIKEPVYIISAPRSATTFLFHSMAQLRDRYTCVKLWEIIFAPSILQKYVLIGIFKMDAFVGAPLKKSVCYLENLLIGNFKKIHVIGLELPEEDEGFLIWNLSSLYLSFFYSDSDFFKSYYQFDRSMDAPSKKRIMKTYSRYIQRHNFVFNRHGERQFLSKNPLMMNKIASLQEIFPDAQLININRDVADTLPSTLALNQNICSAFTSIKTNDRVKAQTIEQLVAWYEMAFESLHTHFPNSHIKVDFKKLIQQEKEEILRISEFLSVPFDQLVFPVHSGGKKHKNNNPYERLSKEELAPILLKLPFMKAYCHE
jgi:hypothetical protein